MLRPFFVWLVGLVGRGPESVYRPYRSYRIKHLLSDKLRFKATQNFYILSYELARLSIVQGSVNMLSYFIGQIIFCRSSLDSRLRNFFYFVQSVGQFVQFMLLVGHIGFGSRFQVQQTCYQTNQVFFEKLRF